MKSVWEGAIHSNWIAVNVEAADQTPPATEHEPVLSTSDQPTRKDEGNEEANDKAPQR